LSRNIKYNFVFATKAKIWAAEALWMQEITPHGSIP
jgi:hypothetical protein